ncbi:flavodoxin family protein [Desulforhopalus sp. IMCC35007]|uniref:flavodoxin family protein n=1 Tax=Desulforhopalus sp. IMCC35007 TaxID=2569543 RepID=UPI0010AE3F87|nr:flavodoxin family protein [Desulforhopalus sp. IMCC35007]TKB11607.1 flavodoxin family protein [Desulforhopalus sp. IMCC35007]
MKILTLHGGARKTGNTATAARIVEDKLRSMGHEIESIFLFDKNIKACLACGKCKEKPESVACVQKDDASDILEKMVTTDLVLFTSPLYFWGLAGPLKTMIDRTFSLYTDYHKPTHASLVEGQRQALLVTGGGPYENNAEPVFTAFNRLQSPHKAINAGELFIEKCTTPEKLEAEQTEQLLLFAGKIVG